MILGILHFTMRRNLVNWKFFKFIYEKVKEIDPKDAKKMTPLHYAVDSGRVSICSFIIDKLDDIHPKDDFGKTPLDYADGHRGILHLFKMKKSASAKSKSSRKN